MNRIITAILAGILLFACNYPCRKIKPVADPTSDTQTALTEFSEQPGPEPIINEDTTPVPTVSAAPDIAQKTAAKQTVTAVQSIPAVQSATNIQPIAATTADQSIQSPEQTDVITVPQFSPFPFKPTFKDEDVIKTEGRMLNPYAELVPDPTAKQTAPWAYEQLKYGIYYSFVKAGTAYIHNLGLVDIDGNPAYVFQTTAFSAPVIDAVFKVRDINQSWLDATEHYSYGYGQSVREGNYVRDEWLKFNYPAQKYEGLIRKKEEPHIISGPLDIKVVDMLSSLYYVRAHDLKVGQDVVFDIVNREKQYPLIVKVLKKEKVKTAAGKFDCIVVEPQFRGEGIFISKGKSLKVWLTDDKYKMPVKMKVEVFIGSVSAELLEYQRQVPANIL